MRGYYKDSDWSKKVPRASKGIYTDAEWSKLTPDQQGKIINNKQNVSVKQTKADEQLNKQISAPTKPLEVCVYCAYCGKTNTYAHRKYKDRCVDCGDLYNKYTSYKAKYAKTPNDASRRKLYQIVVIYKDLAAKGYKVPKDIPKGDK